MKLKQQDYLSGYVLFLLGVAGILVTFGSDAYLPGLASMATDLNATAETMQLTVTAFSIGMAGGQLICGGLSDRLGRRPISLGGLALLAIASIFCSVTTVAALLIIGCAVIGLASSAVYVANRTIISDLTTGQRATQAFSVMSLVMGVGPMLGPLMGGLLVAYGSWRYIFVAIALLAIVLLVTVFFSIGETLSPSNRHPFRLGTILRNAGGVLSDPLYRNHTLVFWFGFGALFAYISSSSFISQNILGLSPSSYGFLFSFNALGMVVANLVSSRLAKKLPARRIITMGVSAQFVGGLVLLIAAVVPQLTTSFTFVGFFVVASSVGFIFGPAIAIGLTRQRHRAGAAVAVLGSLQFVFGGISATLIAVTGTTSILPLAVIVVVCTVASAIFLRMGRAAAREALSTPEPAA